MVQWMVAWWAAHLVVWSGDQWAVMKVAKMVVMLVAMMAVWMVVWMAAWMAA